MLAGLDARGVHHVNESFTRLVYAKVVRENDTVLDIGASEGLHTTELSRLVGPAGVVHAFEPYIAHYRRLQSISDNVRLWPMALGDRLSVETLHVPEGLDGWSSLTDIGSLVPDRKVHRLVVLQAPLDELGVTVGSRLPFIKLDVEHHEIRAIRGALRFIAAHRPLMAVENVDAEIAETMRSLRYTVTDFFGRPVEDRADPSRLPNSLLVPDESLSTTAFLVADSQEVAAVLSEARLITRRSQQQSAEDSGKEDPAPARVAGESSDPAGHGDPGRRAGRSAIGRVLRRLGLKRDERA